MKYMSNPPAPESPYFEFWQSFVFPYDTPVSLHPYSCFLGHESITIAIASQVCVNGEFLYFMLNSPPFFMDWFIHFPIPLYFSSYFLLTSSFIISPFPLLS